MNRLMAFANFSMNWLLLQWHMQLGIDPTPHSKLDMLNFQEVAWNDLEGACGMWVARDDAKIHKIRKHIRQLETNSKSRNTSNYKF